MMEREIKFRGKSASGRWLYGSLLSMNGGLDMQINCNGRFTSVSMHTVGQYTGLKDKNGVDVYEGDILKLYDTHFNNTWYAKVEFGNPYGEYSWGWEFVYIKGDKVNTDCLLWVEMEETGAFCEVVGNIYDNPELLEV